MTVAQNNRRVVSYIAWGRALHFFFHFFFFRTTHVQIIDEIQRTKDMGYTKAVKTSGILFSVFLLVVK